MNGIYLATGIHQLCLNKFTDIRRCRERTEDSASEMVIGWLHTCLCFLSLGGGPKSSDAIEPTNHNRYQQKRLTRSITLSFTKEKIIRDRSRTLGERSTRSYAENMSSTIQRFGHFCAVLIILQLSFLSYSISTPSERGKSVKISLIL